MVALLDTLSMVHVVTAPESLGFLAGQTGFLRAHGVTVHAVASPGESLSLFGLSEGATIHAVPMQRRVTPFRDLAALWRLFRTFRAIRPYVVHAHTPKGGLLGMLAARMAGVPVRIYTIHGLPLMTARGWKRLLLLWTERISCRCASAVLSVSPSIRTVAIGSGICQAQKIKVLRNGSINGVDAEVQFDPSRYGTVTTQSIRRQHKIPDNALVLGFVGRIVRDKGMIELAAAWRILRERFPTLHLLLIGPFESQDPVPEEVETLFRSDPAIHLTGPVRGLPPYYAAMDVCVLPTYREGLPNVALEAAAMEVPMVATRVTGCVDAVVDGVTGLLVPPRDANTLADAITTYLASPDLRRRHGRAGRVRVQTEFRREAIWQALFDEYARLLEQEGIALPAHQGDMSDVQDRRAA